MTAFGRAVLSTPLGRFSSEISSLNRKHLDINIALPKELSRFEVDLRKLVSNYVFRGQVTVKISAFFEAMTPIAVKANLPLARQVKEAWEVIARELKITGELPLTLISKSDVLLYEEEHKDDEMYRQALITIVELALKDFIAMRELEGAALQKDIETRLETLSANIKKIASRSVGATEKYRQKLLERLQEVLPGAVENEERILREICMYAEKIDISEEITRFNSHLNQTATLIKSDAPGIGKTFEFLLQELHREMNTIGSKASDVDISRLVIESKGELEKIREQIQNVE